jgi:CCR4-NOT transcription complex subunit 1
MELERKLQQEFETRQRSKADGRLHYDPNVFAYHTEKIPEMIRLRVGSISPQQFSVYEEFGKNLLGFKINVDERPAAAQQSNFNKVVDDMNSSYENIILTLQKELPTYSITISAHFLIGNLLGLIMKQNQLNLNRCHFIVCFICFILRLF